METRANIVIKDRYNNKVILYHHNDGYWDRGIGYQLHLLCLSGLLIRQTYAEDVANILIKGDFSSAAEKLNKPEELITIDKKYQLTRYIHGDIEYLYNIDMGKETTLTCRQGRCEWDKGKQDNVFLAEKVEHTIKYRLKQPVYGMQM